MLCQEAGTEGEQRTARDSRDSIRLYSLRLQPPPRLRSHSTPLTLRWLRDNYELREGVCIPRSVLFQHYTVCCYENGMVPVNAASFGKIVRQEYPRLTTRRLGTRGKSRYHYYGLAVACSSRFYSPLYAKQHAGMKVKKRSTKTFSEEKPAPRPARVALPEFPSVSRIAWREPAVQRATLHRFLVMYRTHCQRLLDLVAAGDYGDVQGTVTLFWQGMPQHVRGLLRHDAMVQVVASCDGILYDTLTELLLPSDSQPSVERSLGAAAFGLQLHGWLAACLAHTPSQLQQAKLDGEVWTAPQGWAQVLQRVPAPCQAQADVRSPSAGCAEMAQVLQRLPALCQAQHACLSLLRDGPTLARLQADWRAVDLFKVVQLALAEAPHADFHCLTNAVLEFEGLLLGSADLTALRGFMDRLLKSFLRSRGGCVSAEAEDPAQLQHTVHRVYLTWSTFCGELLRRMSHSGAGHTLHAWLTQYAQYRLHVLCLQRGAAGRLAALNSSDQSTSDGSYVDSEDSTQRSPAGEMLSDYLSPAGEDVKHMPPPDAALMDNEWPIFKPCGTLS
ncbi:transcription factor RFX4-like [Pollicipes pollicipes]|uniref:transcription factor RFX4-like n=1 Tax=Pollicipes pollicipes TaxID=41117 RepID=UPI00188538D8|nr:transcription factor RFX4-like [Pollicipes pollicipes]